MAAARAGAIERAPRCVHWRELELLQPLDHAEEGIRVRAATRALALELIQHGPVVPALLERYGAAAATNAPLAAKTARPIPGPSRKEIGATQPEK